jgi:LacI family transcriptional regulator, galactose operon repressor
MARAGTARRMGRMAISWELAGGEPSYRPSTGRGDGKLSLPDGTSRDLAPGKAEHVVALTPATIPPSLDDAEASDARSPLAAAAIETVQDRRQIPEESLSQEVGILPVTFQEDVRPAGWPTGMGMTGRRTGVKMKDVAALAGVSVGTVSNVLNSPQLVAPVTRERVEMAIAKLGWVRNESARQLRAGVGRSVAMVVLDITNPFFADVVDGAEQYVHDHGYVLQLGNSAGQAGREETHLDLFEQYRVRGVLLAPVEQVGSQVARLRRSGIPTVVVDRADPSLDCCSVGVDDEEGGRLAVAHLIDEGHRSVAFVGGPSRLQQVRDRRAGAHEAAIEHASGCRLLTISTPALDVSSGVKAAEEIVALPDGERPTAVFAANDLIGIGMLQGFVTHGLRVPEDVALIGYDDIQFAAAAAVPLSSIAQPRQELGRRAAQLLFDELDDLDNDRSHEHQQVRYTPELVIRRSTA